VITDGWPSSVAAAIALFSCLAVPARGYAVVYADQVVRVDRQGAGGLHSWRGLHQLFKCLGGDDGAIAEGYSDTVVKLLIRTHPDLLGLNDLSRSDPDFAAFVIRHLDGLMSPAQNAAITTLATSRCHSPAHDLCAKIVVRLREVRP
jgi:hypothetical protein